MDHHINFGISLAMIGLIAVQLFWIKQAYSLKEMHFGQLVNNSINDATRHLQEKEIASNVLNSMDMSDMEPIENQLNSNKHKAKKSFFDTIAQAHNYNGENSKISLGKNEENSETGEFWISEQHFQYQINKKWDQWFGREYGNTTENSQ
ncbi:MAG: hypothetical protein HC905_24180 [Bacteroidales bacterium]|nr:hypothetical protein [Bacteroidales bacterium]